MIARAMTFVRRGGSTAMLVWFAVLSAATGAVSLSQLRSAADQASELYDGLGTGWELIGALQYDVQEARRRMIYALTTTDANLQVQYVDESRAADGRVAARVREHVSHLSNPSAVEIAQRFERDWNEY